MSRPRFVLKLGIVGVDDKDFEIVVKLKTPVLHSICTGSITDMSVGLYDELKSYTVERLKKMLDSRELDKAFAKFWINYKKQMKEYDEK